MTNTEEFFHTGGWIRLKNPNEDESIYYILGLFPDGGSIELGFYHSPCHYANYNDGEGTFDEPFMGGDNDADSCRYSSINMICQRCGKEFSFTLCNCISGLTLYEDNGKIPDYDIYYRNLNG